MSRAQQDQFIDEDEEEVCPLCVEEFDISDKGFRPCPCGYQICQFCYNNVKNNMNGLCPACRRTYSDDDIEYKVITPEDAAAHKARQAQKQKKTQAALQKEKQKAEADNLSRKHLAGLRVVQKNLVYVTGLSPNFQEDKLLQTLRGDQYFGQYGKIIKIVVSKAKDTAYPQSVGVYVTYERKEDAQSCISAVDGSKNGERTLRAQFGTTKYCSAYLRGETCSNRNCMFLHEPGEANESYSRADLSALNAGSSQHATSRAPPPQSQQPVASASASQPMARQASADQPSSPGPSRPALPSTASWATKPPTQPSRPASRSTSGTMESPAPMDAAPAPLQPEQSADQEQSAVQETVPSEADAQQAARPPQPRRPGQAPFLNTFLSGFNPDYLKYKFSAASLSQADLDIIKSYPLLFDMNGGAKRRQRREREEEQRRMEQEAQAFQQPPSADQDDNNELSGSLQLGGEPEDRQGLGQAQNAIQPPGHEGLLDQRFQFGGMASPGVGERGLTPQQQQQLLAMKGGNGQGSYLNANQQSSLQQASGPPGHQRNASRYSFANESTASTSVKPVANQKLLNQQSSIMPASGGHFGAQQQGHGNQFYTSNVQGPPPGLKATGTPPVSGGMTFGQGHGFATGGIQYGANATGRNANEEMMRSLLRTRDQGGDGSKHDSDFPPLGPPSRQQSINLDDSRRSTPPVPPGFEAQAASESRRSTPTVPPGLSKPSALPDLDGGSGSRPSSRTSMKRTTSQITPALPLKPTTPSRPATPTVASKSKQEAKDDGKAEEFETPTKAPKGSAASKEGHLPSESKVPAKTEPVKPATTESQDVDAPKPAATAKTKAEPASSNVEAVAESQNKEAPTPPAPQPPSKGAQPAGKGKAAVQASEAKAAPVTPSKAEPPKADSQKRKPPGKLDLETTVKDEVPTPASSKPESPSAGSPAVKNAPRTLRVVPNAKGETPPPAPVATPKETAPPAPKMPSRKPSAASVNPPGTPSSGQVSISDNISVPSASQSRASSPPPPTGSKVGTAPVKAKTKNQLKKERQERAKALEEEKSKTEEAAKAAPDEPAQEAIVSRKKKAKKEKEPKSKGKAAADTTPAASQPASPQQQPAATKPDQPTKATSKPSTPTHTSANQAPPPPPPTHEPSPPPTPTPSAAQLLTDLKSTHPDIQKSLDSLFRSPNSTHHKPSQPILPRDLAAWDDSPTNPALTPDQATDLLTGALPAIHTGTTSGRLWDRTCITPSGAHLRALTQDLETRFLELESALQHLPPDLQFRPAKPQNETRFPSLDLQTLARQPSPSSKKTRGVTAMEQMVRDGSAMKKGAFLVDEAGRYVDEFVMPPSGPLPPPSTTAPQQDAVAPVGVEIAERQLNEARRVAEERDQALRKVMRRNRRVLGLG